MNGLNIKHKKDFIIVDYKNKNYSFRTKYKKEEFNFKDKEKIKEDLRRKFNYIYHIDRIIV